MLNQTTPQMAALAHTPYSAFKLGWTYGPITHQQMLNVRQYAKACDRLVATVPGYWISPPKAS
jgi:hypothetical protein